MKKLTLALSIILILSLMLTSCSENGATSDDTPASNTTDISGAVTAEMLENSKPNEYVKEKLAAGKDVLIACSMLVDVPVLMEVFASDILSITEKEGFSWTLTHAGGDTATMIGQIENFSTMGAACIICVPPDANSIKDTVVAVMDAGSDVVLYGVKGVDYCISVLPDTVKLGQATAEMALAWVHQRYPDATSDSPVKFAAMYSANVEDAKIQGETMVASVEADPACTVSFSTDSSQGSVDGGYEIAQNALTYDSDIRVFVSTQGPDTLGASNYIMAQPNLIFSEYGCFGGACDTAGLDAISTLAPNDGAVIRGSIEYVLTAGQSIGTAAVSALYDEILAPYEYLMEGYAYVQPGFDFSISFK